MGRIPLPDLPRRRQDRAAIEIGQPLTRYFPDLVEAVGQIKAKRFVLDGEIVVPSNGSFSFDDLLQRIHPAASRVTKLAKETPALLIVFDLLVDAEGKSWSACRCRSAARCWRNSPSNTSKARIASAVAGDRALSDAKNG
jgi:hypothetical protein